METIQNITMESTKRPIRAITPVSFSSNNNNNLLSTDDIKSKESQSIQEFKDSMNEKIGRIAETMDSYVQSMQRDLKIQVHEKTGEIIVKVTSKESGKVIREIPSKELLDLAAKIEEMTGILFDEKV
jgi:flagellar protein FlaG